MNKLYYVTLANCCHYMVFKMWAASEEDAEAMTLATDDVKRGQAQEAEYGETWCDANELPFNPVEYVYVVKEVCEADSDEPEEIDKNVGAPVLVESGPHG